MAINLSTMRSLVRKATGVPADDPDLTNAEIDLYLNRAFWETMDKFDFREKERAGAFETEDGIRNYEVPTPVEAMRGVAIVDPDSLAHTPLDQMNARETEELFDESDDAKGKPEKYLLENCYIRLWPTPDQVYKIEFRKWTILSDLSADSDTLPISLVWNDIIIYGANARALYDFGDLVKGTFFDNKKSQLIDSLVPRKQKEIVDYEHAGVHVIGREY